METRKANKVRIAEAMSSLKVLELVFDVDVFPTMKQIRSAYHKLSKLRHPDKGEQDAEKQQSIQAAYNFLVDNYIRIKTAIVQVKMSHSAANASRMETEHSQSSSAPQMATVFLASQKNSESVIKSATCAASQSSAVGEAKHAHRHRSSREDWVGIFKDKYYALRGTRSRYTFKTNFVAHLERKKMSAQEFKQAVEQHAKECQQSRTAKTLALLSRRATDKSELPTSRITPKACLEWIGEFRQKYYELRGTASFFSYKSDFVASLDKQELMGEAYVEAVRLHAENHKNSRTAKVLALISPMPGVVSKQHKHKPRR